MRDEPVKPVTVAVWLGLFVALALLVVIVVTTVEHIDLLWVAGPTHVKLYHRNKRLLLGECQWEEWTGAGAGAPYKAHVCFVDGVFDSVELDTDGDGAADMMMRVGPNGRECVIRTSAGKLEPADPTACTVEMGGVVTF